MIAYASRTFNGTEKNYSVTELECLVVVWDIQKMRGHLERYVFTVTLISPLASTPERTDRSARAMVIQATTARL